MQYRRAGEGPPVVLTHPAITSSAFYAPLIARLAANFTCFAFDSPGFGGSDPSPVEDASIADLADGLAQAMDELGFGKTPIFGYHTGAAVALELGARRPDLVSGLILDGLPIFTRKEVERLFGEDFAPPLVVDDLGGHFASTWTRFRDQAAFYPWCVKTPDTILPLAQAASAQSVNDWVMHFYRAATTYAGPFRSAHTFGEEAADRITGLTVPAAFLIASNDFLLAHVDRLPPLKSDQALIEINHEPQVKQACIEEQLLRFPATRAAPDDRPVSTEPGRIDKTYVDLEQGQMLVRFSGRHDAPALILLHDAPGSGLGLEPLILALGETHRVYAPDLPGCAESDALPGEEPSMAQYVDALDALCQSFGLRGAAAYGVGIGSSLALAFAAAQGSPVTRLVLRGLLAPDAELRAELLARYAPPIAVNDHGEHWYRAWIMLRDAAIYWPWYNRTKAGQRKLLVDLGAQSMHDATVEVVKRIESYHHVIMAALRHDAVADLAHIAQPCLAVMDAAQPFAALGYPPVRTIDIEPLPLHAARIAAFLDDADV